MKPPAASKFLQRGGLGEAHLDNDYNNPYKIGLRGPSRQAYHWSKLTDAIAARQEA